MMPRRALIVIYRVADMADDDDEWDAPETHRERRERWMFLFLLGACAAVGAGFALAFLLDWIRVTMLK